MAADRSSRRTSRNSPRTTSRNDARPGRTLTLFMVGVIALYALIAGLQFAGSGSDDSLWKPRLGLDLQGGTRIALEASDSSGDLTDAKLEQARDIIDQRVNANGVSEAEVTTQGADQVVIEIPGEQRGDLVDQVGRTAQMRFRLVWAESAPGTGEVDQKAVQQAAKTIASVDWDTLSLDQMLAAETQGVAVLPEQYQKGVAALNTLASLQRCGEDGQRVASDPADQPLVTCDPATGQAITMSPTVIEGSEVASADQGYDSTRSQWVVQLSFKDAATETFDQVTEALTAAQQKFAIVLDGQVLSAPTAQAHITNGESEISGSFTAESSRALATQLKYGALPLSFSVNGVSEEGPTLAGTQLKAGVAAGVIGLLLVVVYSLLYYRGLGLVVVSSLLVAAAITYAAVVLLGEGMGFTLTLPGIAGLIVAIGITADSFIVFFERIRDEVRDGKSLRSAVEAAWKRARTTIVAADAVSLLAALVLFIFAIGVVRGFAFALGLTTLIDVLVVFFFTKPLVSLLSRTSFFGNGHKLSGLDPAHLGIEGRNVNEFGRPRPARGEA